PAALFWRWMTAFLGMATKMVEVSLSHKYRVKDGKGTMAGGPMYYMERGLNLRWPGLLFAVAKIGRASCRESGRRTRRGMAGRGRHTRVSRDWSSDVCSSDLTCRAVLDVDDSLPRHGHQDGGSVFVP